MAFKVDVCAHPSVDILLSILPTMPSSVLKTTNLRLPIKSDGTKDNRYTAPQFVKSDGKRDMRTLRTSERK